MGNQTAGEELEMRGLTDIPAIFLLFLAIYVVTLLGNAAIIAASWIDPRLHCPMYFFIANLSFLDLCYSSVTVPKMLANFLVERKTITLLGCAVQMLFFMSLAGTEAIFLAAMAYDRYVAICHPLRYAGIMSANACVLLVVSSWTIGLVDSMVHTLLVFRLSFCGSRTINHFFCDIVPVMQLSCTSTFLNKVVLMACGAAISGTSFTITLTSYLKIVTAILRIHSTDGRSRTFSTCSSHLTVVVLFYVTIMSAYLRISSSSQLDRNIWLAVLYAVITPLLNPFIFSLRNKAMKDGVRRVLGKKEKIPLSNT